jgi:hypothetical protein
LRRDAGDLNLQVLLQGQGRRFTQRKSQLTALCGGGMHGKKGSADSCDQKA